MWQTDTYLITYLRIILSTLIDKQAQRQERRASKHKDKKGERAGVVAKQTFLLPEVLATVKTKGKSFTSSYKEEITFKMEIHQRQFSDF